MSLNCNKKYGVSGFMRVKNDAEFVEVSIDSCIKALDELIIIYNDCSDNTPELIEKKRLEYPDKIKIFEYKYKVYSVNLSKMEYEKALSLPDDSPNLLCNYYNYALSKVNYKYALKIDADQIYFTEQLKKWCDIFRKNDVKASKTLKYYIGCILNLYFKFFKILCFKTKRLYPFLPEYIVYKLYPYYIEYLRYQVGKGRACISLSGVNVFKDGDWFVSLGGKNDVINILPPFNGEGDHLIFEVSEKTYFRKYNMPYYNLLTNTNYSLIEEFVHPYKILCAGFAWFHLNAMRNKCYEKVRGIRELLPSTFIQISNFVNLKYRDILNKADKNMFSLRQTVLFSFIYKSDKASIKKNVDLLEKLPF